MAIQKSTLITGGLALTLAAGWTLREAQFASAAGKRVPNTTINMDQVAMGDAEDEGKKTGQAGVILDGETAGNKTFQVGRFMLLPGMAPHAPHRHPDEEVLLVTKGSGEILCDGKTTQVKPGAVMYTDPNVEHAIKNTGKNPLEFYWIKYVPKGD